MRSFEPGVIDRQPVSQSLLQTVRLLGEYKGKQDLYREQTPQVLEALKQSAIIQSTESSNRIEGVVAPPERIRELVADRDVPRNRSEQEIAGYRDVLATIHTSAHHIRLTPGVVRQLHRDLFRFSPSGGGQWKSTDNEIAQYEPGGVKIIRFKPVPAYLTAEAMEQLHDRFNALWDAGNTEPLLLIPTYVLDFLCIHPFLDGNGRIARLLTLLLLYRAGYEVGRYISLEQIVERTRESYYDTLYRSSQGWHESEHSLIPWWEYFLGVLLSAYREFEQRIGLKTTTRGAQSQMVRDAIARFPKQFRIGDVERACPGVSRPTINRVLSDLRKQGAIVCLQHGRNARWEKT